MPKVDLHTHSHASPDGGLTLAHYRKMLETQQLDYIAITDHNRIDFAVKARKELGAQVIVGEEIMTSEGEIIGLFLQQVIEPLQSPEKTIHEIKTQGGIVYVPHPFETLRKGMALTTLSRVAKDVDILEIYNGRAMQRSSRLQATAWAKSRNIAGAASSDVHGPRGWGRAYSEISESPTAENITLQLHNARLVCGDVGIMGRMYPTLHRTKKRFQKHV